MMEESRKDFPEEAMAEPVEEPVEAPTETPAAQPVEESTTPPTEGPVIGTWDDLWEEQWKEKQRARVEQAALEARLAAEAKAAKKAEAAAKARAAQEARAAQRAAAAEKARELQIARAAEKARLAEQAKIYAEAKAAEKARIAEEQRLAAEARAAEKARLAEEQRLAAEARAAEKARLAEEQRLAAEAQAAEKARLVAEAKSAEQASAAPMASNEPETAPVQKKGFALPKRVYYILIGLFSAALVLSVAYLGTYFWETKTADDEYDDLASLRQDAMTSSAPTQSTQPSQGGITPPPIELPPDDPHQPRPPVEVELKEVYEQNNDLVGWIDFKDESNISYPVMQSPYDEDFYLEHKFNKEPNGTVPIGCPYVPLACDVFAPSDNVIIYGHNVRSGSMFKRLENYRDQAYWESHQTFTFDTLYERHTYQIFAVFRTAATQYTSTGAVYGYPYHKYTNFASEEEFNKFIADVKGAAFTTGGYKGNTYYETGITPQYGDKLVCLSTCEYTLGEPSNPGSRLVVMAVRIS